MVYEVVYKNDNAGGDAGGNAGDTGGGEKTIITEEVSERNLAYAANCPVTIHTIDVANEEHSNRSNDGTILLCGPSSTNPGKFCYTVMIESSSSADDGSSQATYFESGIHGDRIRYRKVVKQQQITESGANSNNNTNTEAEIAADVADGGGADAAAAALPSAAVHARSPQDNSPPPAVNNNNNNNNHNPNNAAKIIPPSVPAAVAHAVHHHDHPPGEVKVPSSITCDSVSKSSHPTERSSSSSNKRKRAPSSAMMLQDNASTLTANSGSHYKQDNNNKSNNHNGYCNNDVRSASQKSIDRYSNAATDVGSWNKGKVDGGRGGRDDAFTLEINTPNWLQRDQTNQLSLFFHLIGSKHDDKRGNRTIKDVEIESNVNIRVNFLDKGNNKAKRHPITVCITSRSRSSAVRDVHDARKRIQDLLLDFVGHDGSRGRLVYDVASSCGGPHRPAHSTSRCVKAKDPFDNTDKSREVFMTLVHLPFEYVPNSGCVKKFCVDFLLTSSLLTYVWNEMNCYVKAAYNGSGIPVTRCYPYLLVMGKAWRDVDQAVE
eukprot:CAMPEP_0196151368 /NCGR_PEP_ID=MMETSP0910-20130528/33550_1 /TAXON_ID=49265 /ORGANISM="Thalassiosira rotula, Strain GSO102" /LENGTH=545 /DNA_ID=CAMNT_0041414729 /DNA_START=124 /DNA_END=1758 /DNA_ORIENTATION=-